MNVSATWKQDSVYLPRMTSQEHFLPQLIHHFNNNYKALEHNILGTQLVNKHTRRQPPILNKRKRKERRNKGRREWVGCGYVQRRQHIHCWTHTHTNGAAHPPALYSPALLLHTLQSLPGVHWTLGKLEPSLHLNYLQNIILSHLNTYLMQPTKHSTTQFGRRLHVWRTSQSTPRSVGDTLLNVMQTILG